MARVFRLKAGFSEVSVVNRHGSVFSATEAAAKAGGTDFTVADESVIAALRARSDAVLEVGAPSGTTFTNLVTRPSGVPDQSGWQIINGAGAQAEDEDFTEGHCLQITAANIAAGGDLIAYANNNPAGARAAVTAGTVAAYRAQFKPMVGQFRWPVYLFAAYFTGADAYINLWNVDPRAVYPNNEVIDLFGFHKVPATAAKVAVGVWVKADVLGNYRYRVGSFAVTNNVSRLPSYEDLGM
jgi:hypothetical protein